MSAVGRSRRFDDVGQSPPFTLCSKINCGSGVALSLTPVRPALDREMAPSPEDRFTFRTQQRSVSLHARRNPLDVWNVLAVQPHRVVVAQSLLFLGVGCLLYTSDAADDLTRV